jgi:SAM-dependent methyltransferase
MGVRFDPQVGIELAVVAGLEYLAAQEVAEVVGPSTPIDRPRVGTLVLPAMDPGRVLGLRLAGAIYLRQSFDVPRPRALLGRRHLEAIVQLAGQVIDGGGGPFRALRISAAGSATAVLVRLGQEMADAVRLPVDAQDGDLVVRIYRSYDTPGWTVAVRTTRRPLSARSWRRASFPGALEATVAAAMVRLGRVDGRDRFLDLCCGSGTILAERVQTGPAYLAMGVDHDCDALRAARANLGAIRGGHAVLVRADATALTIDAGSVHLICANPPWGHQMGTSSRLPSLYWGLLAEAARVLVPGGRLVLLTHQVKLMQSLLDETADWEVRDERRIAVRGHHPRIWTLERRL